MNLKQFATKSGVTIIEYDSSWGGKFGYKCIDSPNTSYRGYKTSEAAYKGWLKGTFGEQTSKVLIALLKQTELLKQQNQILKMKVNTLK